MRRALPLAACAALTAAAVAATPAAASISRGPSTAVDPYVLPVSPGVDITSLLTVGEGVPRRGGGAPYPLAGIPDGLGATPRSRGRFRVFQNQELGATAGIVRRHGQKGAFVSEFRINSTTKAVEEGHDLINPTVSYYDYSAGAYTSVGTAFARFCSSYLSYPGQFLLPFGDPATPGTGYAGQLYMANEEAGDTSRTFSVATDGETEQLPRLGLFSKENTVIAPTTKVRTTVVGLEDGRDGQLWIYSGNKTATGTPAGRAGLKNGTNSVLKINNPAVTTDAQFRSTYGKNTPVPASLSDVDWNQTGAAQNAEAKAEGLTLNRIEDGEFDPRNRNQFYFVTTEGGATTPDPSNPPSTTRDGGGLWRYTFVDVNRPELGGTLTLLLDGSEAPLLSKPDNIAIDASGNLLIQEDPGNNNHLARIVAYNINTGQLGVVARFDQALFGLGAPGLITLDEESSGIIDASNQFGSGTFLFNAQVHKASLDPELVEGGQLLTMKVTNWAAVYTPPVS